MRPMRHSEALGPTDLMLLTVKKKLNIDVTWSDMITFKYLMQVKELDLCKDR